MARGRVISPEATVYVVFWPKERIVKAGVTILPSRVKKFTSRGAIVLALYFNETTDLEKALHQHLAAIGLRAFTNWTRAVPYLGAGGTGFSECYRIKESSINDLMTHLRGLSNAKNQINQA